MPHSHTVLVGPANCGKTHLLVSQYCRVLQASGPRVGRALWLAPTSRAAAAVREELLREGLSACLDPGVTTFDALARRVLTNVAEPPRILPPLASRVLLRRVVSAALDGKQLNHLADAARRSSFVELLQEHIQQLKRHGVPPAAYARSIGSRGDPRLQQELALLYSNYEQLLAEHRLVDTEGCHAALRDALAGDPARWAELDIVVADGFADFTHTQLEILAVLARRSGQLLVSLPGEANLSGGRSELFAKSVATLAELRLMVPQLKVEYMPRRESDWPALDHVAAHLFEHPRDIPAPSPTAVASLDRLEIVAAAGVQDEIVELARNIKRRLVADGNRARPSRPGDYAVVLRNLREAAPRVRDVFDEFGIPHAIEAGVPLAATGLVRTLLDLLRLDADDWPFRRLTTVVTNNLLTFIDRRARAEAEWLIRDLQIASGRDRLLSRMESIQGEAAAATGESANTHRARQSQAAATTLPFLRQLVRRLSTQLPRTATPTDWLQAFADACPPARHSSRRASRRPTPTTTPPGRKSRSIFPRASSSRSGSASPPRSCRAPR